MADGLHEVGLPHANVAAEKQGVETLAGGLCHSHAGCMSHVAVAPHHKTAEEVAGIEALARGGSPAWRRGANGRSLMGGISPWRISARYVRTVSLGGRRSGWGVFDEHPHRLLGDGRGQLTDQGLVALPEPIGRKGAGGKKLQTLPVKPCPPNRVDPGGISGFAQALLELMADITPELGTGLILIQWSA